MFTQNKNFSVVAENTRLTRLSKHIVDQFVEINEMIDSMISAEIKLVLGMALIIAR